MFGLPGPIDLLSVLPRSLALLAEAEAAMLRLTDLLDRVELVVDQSEAVVAHAGAVSGKADRVTEGAQGLIDRTDHVLGTWDRSLGRLEPHVRRVAETLSPDQVGAAVALLERLPTLLGHLDEDLLPLLARLDAVGPDVHAILETVDDLRRLVTGLPGASLLRRFGEDEPPEPLEVGEHRRG